MDHVRVLINRNYPLSTGALSVGGVSIQSIAEQYGTPIFVYDESLMDRQLTRLRHALPDVFKIFYSVKANPTQGIVQFFLLKGCGLEVASGGEFHRALCAGCQPGDILFAGPGKTQAELELVLKHGIGEIHAESPREVQRVSDIASQLGISAKIAVRINPSSEAQGGAMRMGGKPIQFGVDEEHLEPLLDQIIGDQHLELSGVHIFAGTQILDADILLKQYERGMQIGAAVSRKIGRALHTLDFGGGLGIPYFPHESELDLARLQDGLCTLMGRAKQDPAFQGTRFVVEPGRFLMGEAGLYVASVVDVKVSRGKKFLILDGGMNHHLAASGNLGQVIKRNFPIAILNKLEASEREVVDVVGPLCTPLDTLARDILLPVSDVGDLVGVFQSGAYARSASPLNFLSHPTPPEVLVHQGHVELLRRRGRVEDFDAVER